MKFQSFVFNSWETAEINLKCLLKNSANQIQDKFNFQNNQF